MDKILKEALSVQFSAALDMFEKALRECPPELWTGRMWKDPDMPAGFSEFWYVAYHNLFWLDFYLSGVDKDFSPPPPFTLGELDPAGLLPERVYSPAELLEYLSHGRAKCMAIIADLSDEAAGRICRFTWGEMSYLALMLDTMRHTQEHGAQLNMFLGQEHSRGARWVTKS